MRDWKLDTAQFAAKGFLVGVPVLSTAEVNALRACIDRVIGDLDTLEPQLYEVEAAHRQTPGRVVCHFLGGWLVAPELRQLVADPRLTGPCAALLGVERMRFWHDQVFAKPPGHDGVVPWHQDYSYWQRSGPPAHITINIMLDDADAESGCVQFVPGSHKWGLLPSIPFDAPLAEIDSHLSPEQRAAFRPELGAVPAGSATIHHSHTLHGSGPNTSKRPRRALVFNYMAADTRVMDEDGPPLRHAAWQPVGAVLSGPHFPLVWDGGPVPDRLLRPPPAAI